MQTASTVINELTHIERTNMMLLCRYYKQKAVNLSKTSPSLQWFTAWLVEWPCCVQFGSVQFKILSMFLEKAPSLRSFPIIAFETEPVLSD